MAAAFTRESTFSRRRAPKCVAVIDGVISFIGDQKLGGHCIWLTTENGASFYYAHLDRWAAGLYEGMKFRRAIFSATSATPATRSTPLASPLRRRPE